MQLIVRVTNGIEHAMRCAVDAVHWVATASEQPEARRDRVYQSAANQALEALSHIHLAQALYLSHGSCEPNYDRLFLELDLLVSCLLDEIRTQSPPVYATEHLNQARLALRGTPCDRNYQPCSYPGDA